MTNIKNLELNKIYSYAELCEALGEKTKAGDSKVAQLKEWTCFFKWEHPINKKTKKPSKKFQIVENYERTKEKEDGRVNNNFSVRHEQSSFFKEDELQLAILWILGMKAYELYEQGRDNRRYIRYIPCNELYIASGLCNEYFTTLSRKKHYYCKIGKNEQRETVYDLWQVNTAFEGVYDKMKRYSITAFNQLQRKKIVEFSYWKTWNNGKKETLFTDEQMNVFTEKRQDALEWWNETNRKKYGNVGDLYNHSTPREIKKFEEQLLTFLGEDEEFQNILYYASCFKVFYSLRAIKSELTKRGFEVGETKEEFEQAFLVNMEDTVERINKKFVEFNEECLNKKREKHMVKYEQYEKELAEYNAKLEKLTLEERRGFGKRVIEKPRTQHMGLADSNKYAETKEILHLGLQHELNEEQDGIMQGIEHCIKVNSN